MRRMESIEFKGTCMMQAWYDEIEKECKEHRGNCEQCPLKCYITNGDVIKAMFPNSRVDVGLDKAYFYTTYDCSDEDFDKYAVFDKNWWNAPYKAESEG